VTVAGILAGGEEGAPEALSDRRHGQQFVQCVGEDGIAADANGGAECAIAGDGATGVAAFSGVAGCERRKVTIARELSRPPYR
jgi:hypothetical protein